MVSEAEKLIPRPWRMYGFGVLLAVFVLYFLTQLPSGGLIYGLAFSIPLIAVMTFSFRISLTVLVFSLFLDINLFYLIKLSNILTIQVIISYWLTHRDATVENQLFPLKAVFLLFFISVLPSFINAVSPGMSLLMLSNLLLFWGIQFVVFKHVEDYAALKRIIFAYFTINVINTVYLVYQVLGKGYGRTFGFSGIMFGDYAAIAIFISLMYLIYGEKGGRVPIILTLSVLVVGLFLTQTRNPMLNLLIVLFLLVIYMIRRGDIVLVKRRNLVLGVLTVLVVAVLLAGVLNSIGLDVFKRVESSTEIDQKELVEQGVTSNSLLTRFFIWQIGWEAFKAHPVIGIGIYGFPFTSEQYSQLPDILYNRYVKTLTPHVGYYTVLIEAGIIGFIAFLVYITSILKMAFGAIRLAVTKEEVSFAIIFAFLQVYIILSLLFSDAWLWGLGSVLWGLLTGMMFAHTKMLNRKYLDLH